MPQDQDQDLPGEITALLSRWSEGDRAALTDLAPLAYGHLRSIARGFLRREGQDHTLQATALVNELYLRLARQKGLHAVNRTHFYALAAVIMRRILTDYARQSLALKRSGQWVRVPLHEDLAWIDATGDDMVTLDRALDELQRLDERAVRMIDFRYFLGCTSDETAEMLGVSRATVERDLEFARTWLYRKLGSRGGEDARP